MATWPTSRAPVAALQPQPAVEASDTATTAADAAADAGAGTSTDVDAGAGAVVDWARKDANEVLMRDGPAALRACIDDAKALPVKGLYQFNDYWKEVGLCVCLCMYMHCARACVHVQCVCRAWGRMWGGRVAAGVVLSQV